MLADYLNYKITLEDGDRNSVIVCNQFDMDDDLSSLIRYVENKITEGKIVHDPSVHVMDELIGKISTFSKYPPMNK